MKLSKKSAIELGKIIASCMHNISEKEGYCTKAHEARGGALNVFGDIADNIEDSVARIYYCRAFREQLTKLEPLPSRRSRHLWSEGSEKLLA